MKRIVLSVCAAVAAAGICVMPAKGAPASVTVKNAAGEATLSTDGSTWQSSVTVSVQPGGCAQVYDKAGFVRLVPAVAGTYYALPNCPCMSADSSAETHLRADGATIVTFTGVKTSTFLPGGPFLVSEALAVGGGGSGGNAMGGGGGGGGVVLSNALCTVSAVDSLSVTVGAGGTSGSAASAGGSGKSSTVSLNGAVKMSALGGGGGGGWGSTAAKSGGSGGGGCGGTAGAEGTVGQGYAGGDSLGADSRSGGGGGAGGPGEVADAVYKTAGRGGPGRVCAITGTAKTYGAGGGGGGCPDAKFLSYAGGKAGGEGAGAGNGTGAGAAGVAGTGGGGGGGAYSSQTYRAGGNGGSGIVVLGLDSLEPGVTVAGEPSARAADGVPAYGKYPMDAGASQTFTAPSSIVNDAETERAFCLGYRMDTLDPETKHWILGDVTNESTSCTYEQVGTECRRLVWIWREEALMELSNESDEAVLSFDGGATWMVSTNAWTRFGSEVVVTVREDVREVLKLVGPGVVAQPDGSYVVTISGPVRVHLLADRTVLYVSDGLLAFWDVQNNTGMGEMDTGSKYWYDTLDATRCWVLGGSCNFSTATSAMEIPSGSTCAFDGIMPTFVTCDTCMRWDRGRKFFNNTATTGFIFTQTGGFGRESRYMSVPFSAVSGESDTFTYNSGNKTYYRRGLDLGRNHGFEFQRYESNAGNTLGGRFNAETYFQGGVYALRLYSRDLTADEAKRNAALDGLRYLGRALPDGWRMQGARLQARLSFDLGPGVTVSAGGAQIATGESVWLNAGTEVTATVTPGDGEYAIWNGAPLEATFADGGNTITFTLHAPRTLECELLKPDEVWQNGKTLDSKGYSNDTAVVYLPAGTVTGPSVWAKRLVLGGGATAAALTLTKGVTLSDRLDVNRSATLTIHSASAATNGVTVRTGGTIKHTTTGASKTNLCRVDLQTAGTLTVEEGGKIYADSCGYDDLTWYPASDSIVEPSRSGGGSGGGVIRLQVDKLQANGRITANGTHGVDSYYGYRGGSIWITAGTISGVGTISCDGGQFYHNGSGGAGGCISVRLTNPGADFAAYSGRLSAYGGYNYQAAYYREGDEVTSGASGYKSGCGGTVFMETGDGHRTLRIKDGGISTVERRSTPYAGSRFPADEKLTVDDVLVEGTSYLSLVNGADLTVRGDVRVLPGGLYSALGGVVSAAGARVTFADAEKVSHLIGSQNYGTFVCTEPGKKIVFETGKTYTVTTSGAFTLAGSDTEPVYLLPSTADGTWDLTLQSDVARDAKYAAVSNSHALAGLAVTVQGGTDLGGNDSGWAFVDFIEPGAPMRWTGAESSDWKSKGNWVPAREPIATDDITIYSEADGGTAVTNFPVIDAGIGTPQLSKLTIKTGAKVTINGGGLLVTNLLSVQSGGLLDVKGGEVVTVSGDLAFANAACFGCGKGRVILTGDLVQQFDAGTATFNRIYVRKTGGGVTWNDGLTADYFECTTTDDLAFTFQNGKTFTLTQMYLCGLADEVAKLSLASSSPNDCWFLRATTAQRVTGVTVADSDATGGAPVYTGAPSSGNDNTPGWNFGGTCTEWTGKKGDGKFATAGNWSDGVVPGPTSRVAIPCAEGGSVTITMPTTDVVLSNLVVGVGGGTVNLTVNGMLNVTEDLELREKVTMTFNTKKVCTVGRDVMLRSGAKVTHTANTGSADSYAVDMAVGRNFTVEDTAAVTADGLGRTATFAIHGGSSGYNNAVDGEQGACYDSVFEPILSGGDGDKKGGGIVHLTVDGTLSVCGSVTANGKSDSRKIAVDDGFGSGAGGSVWIACARLVGSGLIAADGGCGWHTGNLGGGGRVAVQLTDPTADFDAFGGTVQALYGRNDQYTGEYPSGGCGTVSLRTADGAGEIRIGDIENNLNKKLQNTSWTDLPMAADGSARKAYKQQTVVLGKRGRLRLTDDVTIQDLVLEKCVNGLADFKRNIMLNGHTLTIVSRAHKDGKGWYSGWENYVIKGSNSVTGAKGKIVWKGGMCLIVR